MNKIQYKYHFLAVAGLYAISFNRRLRQAVKRIPLLSLPQWSLSTPAIFFIIITNSHLSSAQMQAFQLDEVKLNDGIFKNAQQIDLKYILKLSPDKLLAPYLMDAGLPLKAERYGNWESSGLDGHIGGHYLSALAMMYASTGNPELKNRLDYMVSELARCQINNGNGYVGGIPQGKIFWERIHKGDIDGSSFGLNNTWVPLYNIHKLFAGLNDAYIYTNNQQAKQILISLGNWFIELIKPLSETQIQQVLQTEHGGINESFADLYLITNDKKYLETAQKLSHLAILNPLIQKQDKLTGLHANTQIPKVIGFEKIGQILSDKNWTQAANYFWRNVALSRSVAFGGNSVREHFNPTNDFSKMLESNQGPETCNSYNMLRLSKALFLNNNDITYFDFYERTLYNHILSSQHPINGGFVYFTPIRPNHYRVYSQPETSMWCCVGSGIENHTKYGELIYSHNQKDIFVNLFIPSELNWKAKGVGLVQHTNFPYQNASDIVLKISKKQNFIINIRYPNWADSIKILVNGKVVNQKPGEYISIKRTWKNKDKISFIFATKTHLEYLPDSSNWAAFMHGPIVLAAKTSTQDLPGLFADDSRMGHEAKGKLFPINSAHAVIDDTTNYLSKIKTINNLRFSLDSLILLPFFEVHDARYQMYFQTYSKNEYQHKKQQEAAYNEQEANIIDKINCGEQQPEVDHFYKGEHSDSGYDEGNFWRNTRSIISYKLQNKNLAGKNLEINVLDNFKIENMDIRINEIQVEIISTTNNTIIIKLPETELVNLEIIAKNNVYTPRFHLIKIVN